LIYFDNNFTDARIPINPNKGGITLDKQNEIEFDGKPVSRELIEKMLDRNNVGEEIIEMMTKAETIDWTALAALQVYINTDKFFTVKNDEKWLTNFQIAQKRLDTLFCAMSEATHILVEKGFLTNSISKEWRSKKHGFEMYSIEYLTSNKTETQFFIHDGEYHSFTNQADAEKFMELYLKIRDIIMDGKIFKPSSTEIVIVVRKVAKRIEIKR